jgi:hypothetical protein
MVLPLYFHLLTLSEKDGWLVLQYGSISLFHLLPLSVKDGWLVPVLLEIVTQYGSNIQYYHNLLPLSVKDGWLVLQYGSNIQ